jgi:hypothetical protein
VEVSAPNRPLLPTEEDRNRAEHQALRDRMLDGEWAKDLEAALNKHIDSSRRTAWGIAEMSRNPFRSIATQVGGALYQTAPTARGVNAGEELVRRVADAGYWQLMQHASTDLVGLRETVMRVDYTERGGLLHRSVDPHHCHIEAIPELPDEPALLEEMQLRCAPDGSEVWTWEVLDVRDLMNPRQQILSADRKTDLTAVFLGGAKSGESYQYRDSLGKPFMPAVLYHAERTGKLWDHRYGLEAVLGSLTVGVLLTFWVHGLKDGSFVTIALVNGRVAGLEVRNADGSASQRTQVISVEPGSFVPIEAISDNLQPSVVQLQPGFDPMKVMEAIGLFEAGLAEYAGVNAADLVRTGADPRSGVSLSISREGLRTAQARFEPQLRRGDLSVLSISAKVLNAATGTAYPETGYTIGYPSLPLSSAEVQALREDLLAKTAAGLMSKVDAYMRLNPGTTREQAIADLQRIRAENALFL